MLTPDLDALEALEKKATPGPWRWRGSDLGAPVEGVPNATGAVLSSEGHCDDCERDATIWGADADRETIAAARNALPGLLARVRELEAALETTRKPLSAFARSIANDSISGARTIYPELTLADARTILAALGKEPRREK